MFTDYYSSIAKVAVGDLKYAQVLKVYQPDPNNARIGFWAEHDETVKKEFGLAIGRIGGNARQTGRHRRRAAQPRLEAAET